MGLRLRVLVIDVNTSGGPYGVRLEFQNGLNVIRAPNTRGKSTCVNSIFYALGLEGMLGPSHGVPLPAAMTEELLTADGLKQEVRNSRVMLEVVNSHGEIVTVERSATGEKQLIRVIRGAALSEPNGSFDSEFMHVRIQGSAREKKGFHRFLAEFIGLELPEVRTGTGSAPLYFECLAPFFFVDQLNGWDAVKSRMPTHLGIIEVAKRSFEFVMALDVLMNDTQRRNLESQLITIEEEWRKHRDELQRGLSGTGVVARDIPASPNGWNEVSIVALWVTDGTTWTPLSDAIRLATERLEQLTATAIPKVADITDELVNQLRVAEDGLATAELRFTTLQRDVRELESELVDIQKRLDDLDDNLREYEDEQKIRKRHAENHLDVAKGMCPACHRPIKDALIDQESPASPMSLPANIAFLRDQRRMFEEMQAESLNLLEAKREQRGSLRNRLIEESSRVQVLKQTLRQDAQAPAAAIMREQIILEARLATIRATAEQIGDPSRDFQNIAVKYAETTTSLKNLGPRELTSEDFRKLTEFDGIHKQLLQEFGFASYKPNEIEIGRMTYQPTHNDLPLGLVSASDMVRMVWAYLFGLLHTSRSPEYRTNHWGLLVIDEPRQQNVEIKSYDALLKCAATAADSGQQVIIASSQLPDEDANKLIQSGIHFRDFTSRILSPV